MNDVVVCGISSSPRFFLLFYSSSSCKKGEMVIVIILEVPSPGTRQTVCTVGKISKRASLITHLPLIGNCIETLSLSLHTN